jgi:hypothetical protein
MQTDKQAAWVKLGTKATNQREWDTERDRAIAVTDSMQSQTDRQQCHREQDWSSILVDTPRT